MYQFVCMCMMELRLLPLYKLFTMFCLYNLTIATKNHGFNVMCCYWFMSRYHVPRAWLEASNNLLVVFEETGGNPFEISVKLRSAKVICAQVSESHYPPLRKWSRADLTGGNISRNDMTPEMHLKCQDGHIMSSIEFASYGTPNGSCQKFSRGNCHASNSSSVVTEVNIPTQLFEPDYSKCQALLVLRICIEEHKHMTATSW